MRELPAEIGVFGGSGFYSFLQDVREVKVDTPYGPPSDRIALAELAGRRVAFLPRHGKDHQLPPHRIPYRANLWAMRELGVTRVIGPCAAGSLQAGVGPGDLVIADQFVDRTWGREDTYFEGPVTVHASLADPYCSELRSLASGVCREHGFRVHDSGTVVVIQGPRFSTRAESRWFSSLGWQVINMTQYPEVVLARELNLCYVNLSLITDYDVGVEGRPEVKAVTAEEVLRVFRANNERLRAVLASLVGRIPSARGCECGHTVARDRFAE
ncbi:MAG TPA: S-methyl-5'-thioadenosine phosphorylase [Bacillota bacterium]|nr:S-methyl-5'-thioadenosine phosphorylase [Bacillota bacterium]